MQWPSARSSHVGISENTELVEKLICSHETALHVYKNLYDIEREINGFAPNFKGKGNKGSISWSSVRRTAKHDLQLKTYKHLSELSFARYRHFISQS